MIVRASKSAKQAEPISDWWVLWVSLFFLSASPLFAQPSTALDRTIQQYIHTAWSDKEGAPTGIWALAQTYDGYLWIGGDRGLYRFDGASFERYQKDMVTALYARPNGDLWFGGRGSIALLRNGKETRYGVREGVPLSMIVTLAADAEGTIWAATSEGLVHLEGDRWILAAQNWNFPGKYAHGMCLDRHGTLWIATKDSIVFLSRGAHRFQPTGISTGEIWRIVEAPNGKLWLSETTRSVRPMPLGNPLPPSDKVEIAEGSSGILFDREGALWISTVFEGIHRVSHPERLLGQRYNATHEAVQSFSSKEGLTDDFSLAMLEDREGNIWVGTKNGLDCFRKGTLLPIVAPYPLVQPILVARDGGVMTIATDSGAFETRGTGQITLLPKPDDLRLYGYRDSRGISWWSGNGFAYRLEGGRLVRIPPKPKKAPFQRFPVITEDKNGGLWGAVQYEGIFHLAKDDVWRSFPTPPSIVKLSPRAAFTDSTGRIWLGFANGGALVTLEGGKLQVVLPSGQSPVGYAVQSIAGRGKHVWIGGEKLLYFDGSNFHEVFPDDVPSFDVRGIDEMPDGSLWLAEQRGVVHISSQEVQNFLQDYSHKVNYRLFDSADGLPGSLDDSQARSTVVEGSDGRLWFAATKGVAWLDPTAVVENHLAPPVSIRSVEADGKHYTASAGLVLPPRLSNLAIAYTALSLSDPSRVRFRYRLEGIDNNWQDPGGRREAFYTKLAPGKYHFQVIACNNDGVWNETGASLEFSVLPAYYQTIWFETLCIAAAAGVLWMIYILRLRYVTAGVTARLSERLQERERIARDLHDTLLQDFQAVTLRFQVVTTRLKKEDPHRLALEEGLDYADKVLAEGRDHIRDIRADTRTGDELSESLTQYGNELSKLKKISFSMIVNGSPCPLDPIVRDEIHRIGREAIGNSFKHSNGTRVEVAISYGADQFQMKVYDDGIGIDSNLLSSGRPGHWGIQNMRERAGKIGASFEFSSETHGGTLLVLEISVRRANTRNRPWHFVRSKANSLPKSPA